MIQVATPAGIWRSGEVHWSLLLDSSWVVEPKYNGYRCLVHFTEGGIEYKTKSWTPHRSCDLPNEWPVNVVPCDSVFDGEWIRKSGELIIFDVPRFDGQNWQISLEQRRAVLKEYVPQLGKIRLITRYADREGALSRALKEGHEGVVFKSNAPYPRGNTSQWLKMKG